MGGDNHTQYNGPEKISPENHPIKLFRDVSVSPRKRFPSSFQVFPSRIFPLVYQPGALKKRCTKKFFSIYHSRKGALNLIEDCNFL